jgi:DNA-binding transcriptional ArsR family regulator
MDSSTYWTDREGLSMKPTHVNEELFEREAAICRAFANPTRLRVLDALVECECGAMELQKRLSLSSANLSQHLTILRAAGLITTHRRGNQMWCSLRMPEVKQACQTLRNMLRAQIRQSRSVDA